MNDYPEAIQIELTDRCNGRCVMCHHYYEENRRSGDMPLKVFDKLSEYIPHAELVFLNGYGESMLSRHFDECIQKIAESKAKAIITTNLSILSEKTLGLVPDVFGMINVSCHGPDRESYERISMGLDFSAFVYNLDRLSSSVAKETCAEKKAELCLSVVAMAANILQAEEFVGFAHKYGIPKIRFGRLGINAFLQNHDLDLIAFPDAAKHCFDAASNRAREMGIEIVFPANYSGATSNEEAKAMQLESLSALPFPYCRPHADDCAEKYYAMHQDGNYQKKDLTPMERGIQCEGICDWVAKGLYIDKNGDCYPCCESKAVCYGNIVDSGYEEMLKSPQAENIVRLFESGTLPGFCYNCPFILNGELPSLHVFSVDSVSGSPVYEYTDIKEVDSANA